MKQEQINSLIRTVLTLAGAFLTGGGLHYFFGHEIDAAYWEEITGIILAIVSIIWSISTKTIDIEKLQGSIRQVITFICGILVAKGLLNAQTSIAVIAFVGAIIPYIQAGLARKKSEQIANGKIKVAQLKGNNFIILLCLIILSVNADAQSSFKRMPKPGRTNARFSAAVAAGQKPVTAFRFTGPIAGFMYPQNLVVTGLGYGWQRMHFVDSTQKYYTDFSISGVVYAGGNVRPGLNPNNIISAGISLGILNQLLMIGPAYNFPKGEVKGSFGVVFNISIALNN